ncbi:Yip1 family protein [Marimonas lutisalis]|uniref:Yip1 family protein n=1 Tax=Marimonas lutisalis TaxID=2545756 RepID=UPI00195F8D13|nr:Yip1 family protein [Marimonas lutisalis]
MKNGWQDLVKMTFMAPNAAAEQIMSMRRALSNEVLWMAVILVAILNAIVVSGNLALFPPDAETAAAMPPAFNSPGLLAMFVAGGLVISVFVLYWAGRALGGTAELADVLAALTWLELVQVGVQIGLLVLALAIPSLAQIVGFVASFWMLYILIAFLDTVHGFNSPLRAVGVVLLSFGLLIAGLMFFLLLIGAMAEGAG